MQILLDWWPAVAAAWVLVAWTVVIRVLLRGARRASNTLAWLMVLIFLPGVGVVLWFMMEETVLGGRRRRRREELTRRLAEETAHLRTRSQAVVDLPEYEDAISLASAVGGAPPRPGNQLELMGDTDQVLDRLIGDIDQAKVHCHLLFYIWLDDEAGRRVATAIAGAAARGVECRLLLDDVGSRGFLRSETCEDLRRAGVQVVRALPASLLRVLVSRVDLRNHRKVAVIDGLIGYTGSQNIACASFAPKRKYAPWVDCMVRLEGPVVRDLQDIFLGDWYPETEETPHHAMEIDPPEVPGGVGVQILPTGPGNDNEALEQMALASFHRAHEELILTTPYFVPGPAEVASLCTAARRGVRVVLVLPARCDSRLVGAISRSHFPALLDAGVEVYEFQEGLLHAKTLTVDRRLALVTTANFDQRSFDLNYEVSTLVYDDDFASQLRFLQMDYVQRSTPVDSRRVSGRGVTERLWENTAGVFSPLL